MSFVVAVLLAILTAMAILYVRGRFLGFRAQTPADLAARGPRFDPRTHLNGPLLCEGVIFGPTGRVVSRFVADMEGTWEGNRGVLRERFRYDSGTVQDRAWKLDLGNDGTIRAEAADVVGAGTGKAEGPAVMMRYRIRLPEDAGGHVLSVTDWMYLVENGTIMNRSQFTKFGVTVAELVATMRRVPA